MSVSCKGIVCTIICNQSINQSVNQTLLCHLRSQPEKTYETQ